MISSIRSSSAWPRIYRNSLAPVTNPLGGDVKLKRKRPALVAILGFLVNVPAASRIFAHGLPGACETDYNTS